MKTGIFLFYLYISVTSAVFALDKIETGITSLRWKYGPHQILRELRLGTYQVIVSGYYLRSGWKLYLGDYEVKTREDGEFTLPIPVSINRIKAEFFARNGKNGVENEIVNIDLGDYFRPIPKADPRIGKTRRWFEKQLQDMSLNLGLGTSLFSYDQTSLPVISQAGFTPKADLTYVFAQNEWSLESSTYLSLFSSLKLFGIDSKLGYEIPLQEGKMAFYLFGGIYYATSFGSDTIGYTGVYGPLIYPALRTTFRNGSILSFYGKYCPIFNEYLPMSLDNASASVGVSYFFKPFSGNTLRGVPFGLSLDMTRLKLSLEGGSLAVTTYTLSGNLLF